MKIVTYFANWDNLTARVKIHFIAGVKVGMWIGATLTIIISIVLPNIF